MSEKKKSFAEFLSNEALDPDVQNETLQKVNVTGRKIEGDKYSSKATKKTIPSVKKKPVALFGLLFLAFIGLTVGLSFVSLWALFGIIPTLLCFWKMVLNNADNNYKSVYSRFDGKYVDKEFEKKTNVEELGNDLVKSECKNYFSDFEDEDNEEKKTETKNNKTRNNTKNDKDFLNNDNEEEEEDEEEEEEKDNNKNKEKKKVEKSENQRFGFKVGNNAKKNVDNDDSRTSLKERNKKRKMHR